MIMINKILIMNFVFSFNVFHLNQLLIESNRVSAAVSTFKNLVTFPLKVCILFSPSKCFVPLGDLHLACCGGQFLDMIRLLSNSLRVRLFHYIPLMGMGSTWGGSQPKRGPYLLDTDFFFRYIPHVDLVRNRY